MDHYIASSNHPLANLPPACEYLAQRGFRPDPQLGCSIVFRGDYPPRRSKIDQPVSSVATLWKKSNDTFSILVQCACRADEENLAEQLHAEIVACGESTIEQQTNFLSLKSGGGAEPTQIRIL
jgi:hypothetical protein